MLSHTTLGVADVSAAQRFYGPLLGALGLRLKFADEHRAGWMHPTADRPLFIVCRPFDGKPASPGNGQMIAFLASSRSLVDTCYALALEHGGTDEGRPALRLEYHANYYGAYFKDPYGNKLCVCCHARAVIPGRWLALAVLLTGAFLPIFDFTVVNLALPSIRADLHASSSEVQFVISAYAATYAVMLITGGRFGDLFGRKRMFVAGIAGFTLASLLCGLANSPFTLVLGRIFQALMAAMMAPQVLASIRVLFSDGEQERAIAKYAATFGLANVCGQLAGGLLVSAHPFGLPWQAIFFVNVPIGVVAFIGGIFFLTENLPDQAKKLDIPGVLLLSLALGCLVYPLIEGREAAWPLWIFGVLLVSVAASYAFVRYEARQSAQGHDPLVELSLFRDPTFVIGVVMGLLFYMLSAFYLTFSVYLQGGLHRSPMQAGLATLPFAVGFFLSSTISSHVMRRLGNDALTLGFVLQSVGFGMVTVCVACQTSTGLAEGLACAGIGNGLVMPGVIKAIIGNVLPRHAGLASGIVMTTLQIGSALGIAVVGGVFYSALGARSDLAGYAHAFCIAVACNVLLLMAAAVLSRFLPRGKKVHSP